MQIGRVYRAVRPYVAALAVVGTAATLVFAIYFTQTELPWVTFLTGVFVASIIAMTVRATRSQWVIARRSAKLSLVQEKLTQQSRLREKAEEKLAALQPRLYLIDEALPVMVAYADAGGRFQYHNRPFRDWLNLGPHHINRRPLRNVLGPKLYGEMAGDIHQVMAGRPVLRDWTTMSGEAIYRLSARYLPHFGDNNKVEGFHVLITDLTEHKDVRPPARSASPVAAPALPEAAATNAGDAITEPSFEKDAASRIVAALKKDEFQLFGQRIVALPTGSGEPNHCEILIRLIEEEESMMPPGAFFPIAEKYGLMPHLDRWVVEHALERLSNRDSSEARPQASMFFINVASATLLDREFPRFVGERLKQHELQGGLICFELMREALSEVRSDAIEFAKQIRAHGCRIALCGFGREPMSFDLLRDIQVDFLKIDGSVILGMLRDPSHLARVVAINRVAKTIGVKTIAELVEDAATIAKLRDIGVDFAQGFGIDRPQPLAQ
jgi:EAL domain-containing protein (putative c-di-GMP-specific phosphodiesterase class I)/PAS domain-containing protein